MGRGKAARLNSLGAHCDFFGKFQRWRRAVSPSRLLARGERYTAATVPAFLFVRHRASRHDLLAASYRTPGPAQASVRLCGALSRSS